MENAFYLIENKAYLILSKLRNKNIGIIAKAGLAPPPNFLIYVILLQTFLFLSATHLANSPSGMLYFAERVARSDSCFTKLEYLYISPSLNTFSATPAALILKCSLSF